MIESGEHASITDLARAEHINQSYACRLLRLTLLAPDIILEILNGRQSHDLMLKDMLKPLPTDWVSQRAILIRRDHSKRSATE